jgi:hypothetical protein
VAGTPKLVILAPDPVIVFFFQDMILLVAGLLIVLDAGAEMFLVRLTIIVLEVCISYSGRILMSDRILGRRLIPLAVGSKKEVVAMESLVASSDTA